MSDFSDFLSGKSLVLKDYPGSGDPFQVSFTEDGWGCATDVAKHYGKDLQVWKRDKRTIRYLDSLIRREENLRSVGGLFSTLPLTESTFIRTFKGKGVGGGSTYIHPKLFVDLTRWVDVDFSIWADEVIFDLLSGNSKVSNSVFQQTQDFIQQFVAQGVKDGIDIYLKSLPSPSTFLLRDSWEASSSYGSSNGIRNGMLTNSYFEAVGCVRRIRVPFTRRYEWSILPIAKGYIEHPDSYSVPSFKLLGRLLYAPLAIHLLSGYEFTVDHYSVSARRMSDQEKFDWASSPSNPKGILFMQVDNPSSYRKPTMADIASKVADIAKLALEKIPSPKSSSHVESEESKKEEDPPAPLPYANVVNLR